MKISYKWLKTETGLDLTVEQMAERLTSAGFPVESLEPLADSLEGVVVARIEEVEPHPNADRLSLTKVHDGTSLHSVICGAKNIAPRDIVAFAPVGTQLPDIKIKEAKIRGVESQGMICSARELGLPLVEWEDGILQLPGELKPGTPLAEALGLDDIIMDIELTANRGDCLSLRGLVTELAAAAGQQKIYGLPGETDGSGEEFALSVNSEACPCYTGRIIRNVRVKPSPLWLQLRLLACGMRPVNNIVDSTNLAMLELGQPLHAFDLNKLPAREITVRQAKKNETIKTLDDKLRQLDPSTMLITSGDKPVAIAGVMGSLDSEVDRETTDILLESALFDGGSVRSTAKALGIASEAATRFEKGVDPAVILPAAHRATQLILDVADGNAGGVVVAGKAEKRTWQVSVDLNRVNALLGTEISQKDAIDILTRLGLEVSGKDQLTVTVDGRRNDLEIEEDIAEELARIHGYDKIPATLPKGEATQGIRTTRQRQVNLVRDVLAGCGLTEVVSLSFVGPDLLEKTDSPAGIPLLNPITRERSRMRSDMLPSLLEQAAFNLGHQRQGLAIFEVGHTYHSSGEGKLPDQKLHVSGLLGGKKPLHWDSSEEYDFFDCKGVVERLVASLGARADFRRSDNSRLHPGRCAEIVADGQVAGVLGQIHPGLSRDLRLEQQLFWFDIDLDMLLNLAESTVSFSAPSRHPAVLRDLALEMEDSVEAASVVQLLQQAGGSWLESVICFDVYQHKNLGEGRKSLAYALSFRHPSRTLKDTEVQQLVDKIVGKLEEHGIRLRG